MKNCDLAVNGGGGAGPEAVPEAIVLLHAAARKFQLKLNRTNCDIGGKRSLRAGEILPDSALGGLRKFPAIRLGAIGHPNVKPAILEKGIRPRTRFEHARAAVNTRASAKSDFLSVH